MIVKHARGSYEISFTRLESALRSVPTDAVYITDRNVATHYGDGIVGDRLIVIEPGEASKSVAVWAGIQSQLATMRVSRSTTLVALGGGVVGDLAGFVASGYMRGVPFVQIPTTLLSQVDSSVGGKVGI